jgi:hypothetical protein
MAEPDDTSSALLERILAQLQADATRDTDAENRRQAFEQEQRRLVGQIAVGRMIGEIGSIFGGMKNLFTPGAFVGDFVSKGQERAKILLDLEKRSLSFGNSLENFKEGNTKMSEFMDKYGTKFGADTGLEAIGTGIATMNKIPESVMDLGMQMKLTGQNSEQLFMSMRALNVMGGLQTVEMDKLATSITDSSVDYGISTGKLSESIMLLSDRMLDYGALGLSDEVADLVQAATAQYGAGSERVITSFIDQLTRPGNLVQFSRMGISQADIDAAFDVTKTTADRLSAINDIADKMGVSFTTTTEIFKSGAMSQFEAQGKSVQLTGEIGKTALAFSELQKANKIGMKNQGDLSESIVNQKDVQTELFNSLFDSFGELINSVGFATQSIAYFATMAINMGATTVAAARFGGYGTSSSAGTPITFGGGLKEAAKTIFLPKRAEGGAINAGESYMTGERAPEVVSTKTGGARVSVIDNSQLNSIMMKSMGAMSIVNSVQALTGVFEQMTSESNSIMNKLVAGLTTLITVTQTASMVKSMGGLQGVLGPLAGIVPMLGPLLPMVVGVGAVAGLGTIAYNMYQDSKERRIKEETAKRREDEEKRRIAQGETNRMLTGLSAEIKSSVLSQALGQDEQKIIIDLLKQNLDAAYNIAESGQKTAKNTRKSPPVLDTNTGLVGGAFA